MLGFHRPPCAFAAQTWFPAGSGSVAYYVVDDWKMRLFLSLGSKPRTSEEPPSLFSPSCRLIPLVGSANLPCSDVDPGPAPFLQPKHLLLSRHLVQRDIGGFCGSIMGWSVVVFLVRPSVRPPFRVDAKWLLACQLGFQDNDPLRR